MTASPTSEDDVTAREAHAPVRPGGTATEAPPARDPPSTPRSSRPPAGEILVISAVLRILSAEQPALAILVGFETAMRDFEAAFALDPPRHWTYSDIFREGIRPDMGYTPTLLERLYRLYEPIRYGRLKDATPGELVETLRLIYAQPALRIPRVPVPGLPKGVRERGTPIPFPSRPSAIPRTP